MAYQTGSATDVHDLLDQLRVFLIANGYTVNNFSAIGSTAYRLNVSIGSLYINLCSALGYTAISSTNTVNGIAVCPSTGFTESPGGSRPWKNQPGAPTCASANRYDYIPASMINYLTGAIPNYWFFAEGSNFVCVVEIATGQYEWLTWGQLDLFGTFADSLDGFFTATSCSAHNDGSFSDSWNIPFSGSSMDVSPTGFLYYSYSGFTQNWFSLGINTSDYSTPYKACLPLASLVNGSGNYVSYCSQLISCMPADLGMLSPLLPCLMGVQLSSTSELLMGHFDLVRLTNILGFTDGQEITLGSDTWKIFPATQRTSALEYALAVRKTT